MHFRMLSASTEGPRLEETRMNDESCRVVAISSQLALMKNGEVTLTGESLSQMEKENGK